MTVVITPVGTSLFNNGAEHNTTIADLFPDIKDMRDSDWDDYLSYIEQLRTETTEFIRTMGITGSAEFQSTHTIQDNLGGETEISVHLFASDTIASRLAAEILKATVDILDVPVPVEFNYPGDVIRGLQVRDPSEFQMNGMPNLKAWLAQTCDNLKDDQNIAINITGGYAATVPYLTIFAQDRNIPLYYNFEDATTLINLL